MAFKEEDLMQITTFAQGSDMKFVTEELDRKHEELRKKYGKKIRFSQVNFWNGIMTQTHFIAVEEITKIDIKEEMRKPTTKTCYTCGQQGHYSPDCPQRKKVEL